MGEAVTRKFGAHSADRWFSFEQTEREVSCFFGQVVYCIYIFPLLLWFNKISFHDKSVICSFICNTCEKSLNWISLYPDREDDNRFLHYAFYEEIQLLRFTGKKNFVKVSDSLLNCAWPFKAFWTIRISQRKRYNMQNTDLTKSSVEANTSSHER